MEKDLESWLHNRQFPNAKSSKLPLDDIGMQNSLFPCAIPCTIASSTHGGLSSLPIIMPRDLKEPHGWFHCLSRSKQGLIPDVTLHDNFMPKTNLSGKALGIGNVDEANTPVTGSGGALKQFLVFDQTGDKTTMMFSSGVGTSIPLSSTWNREPHCSYNFNEDGHYSGANLTDYLDDDHGSVVGSDMREDSEEIDALLYSEEEDDYSDDGEETSTGHSPSTMTAYEKHHHDWSEEEDLDEVASSAGPVKRLKLSESDYKVPTVTYTSSYVKPKRSFGYEDDAESSCNVFKPESFTKMGSLTGNKRTRRDKICEVVSVLQTILPRGKGKNEVMVLDEAINYLRTLKSNAKSLGLSEGSDCPLDL